MPAVKFEDYYQTLGVARTATPEEIQRAYRKLARQYHPDVSKDPASEAKFKKVSEAYEVLKDPEKRKRYDLLGENYKNGQEFTPPPEWESRFGGRRAGAGGASARGGRGGGFEFRTSGGGAAGGDFSDFFETFFGSGGLGGLSPEELQQLLRGQGGAGNAGAGGGARGGFGGGPQAGQDIEANVTLSIEDAYHGVRRTLSLRDPQTNQTRTLDVKIPAGVTEGSTIRLAGQGGPGSSGAPAGDLLLKINFQSHDRWSVVDGHDLLTKIPIAPWEAALGAKIDVPTLEGNVTLTIPPGAASGAKLRLRNQGLKKRASAGATPERGDLLVELKIVVPKTLSDKERELFEALRSESKFNPRS